MGRVAKHNWKKLFLEYNQGRYKSVAEFAKKKGLNPNQVRDEFRKVKSVQQTEATENDGKKQQRSTGKKDTKKISTQKPHPWQNLKKQFTDWPEEKLQAYVVQLTARRDELEAIPFEELTPEEVKELGQVRRERRVILSDPDPEHICPVVRNGKKCNNPVERGKNVCWSHGGAPGSGTRPGQQHNLKHGLYAKILPECDEFKELVEDIDQQKSPIDILWHDIVILQAQIMWSQRVMFVTHKQEMIKEIKKIKSQRDSNPGYNPENPDSEPFAEVYREEEWEFQFAWDRQATQLKALATSMKTLDGLVQRYEAMANDEQKLKIQKLKQDMEINRERLELEKIKASGEDGDEKEIYVDTSIPGVDDGDQDD